MKCPKCGFESELTYPVCPQCQAEIQPNPAAQRILLLLKDTLFLVLCILTSVSCVMSISAGNMPLINILITVFLWLTYSQSRKDIANAKHLRCVSGVVYANYVITYVVAGLIVVLGVILTAAIGYIVSDPLFLESMLTDVTEVDLSMLTELLAVVPSAIVLVVFIIAAAIVVVVNIFSMRYIHRFVQSVYKSIEAGALDLKHVNTAKIWLFIFGGFAAINILSAESTTAMVAAAADCATCIIAGILINKYLSDAPALEKAE